MGFPSPMRLRYAVRLNQFFCTCHSSTRPLHSNIEGYGQHSSLEPNLRLVPRVSYTCVSPTVHVTTRVAGEAEWQVCPYICRLATN